MNQYLKDVRDFQDKFRIPMSRHPRILTDDLMEFRANFMQEELDEFRVAVETKDIEKTLDALVDLQYVLLGTVLMMGMGRIYDEAWDRVHDANMHKQAGKPTGRHGTLDVSKPPGWRAPTFTDLFDRDQLTMFPPDYPAPISINHDYRAAQRNITCAPTDSEGPEE